MGRELEKLREMASRKEAVRRDDALSTTGKNERINSIMAEMVEYKPVAVTGLKNEMSIIKRKFHDADKVLTDAVGRRDAEWNYERLAYNAQAVRSAFEGAGDAMDASRVFDEIKASRDNYRVRAACEIGGEIIGRRFDNSDSIGLRRMMRSELEKVLHSDDVKEAQAGMETAAGRILEFVNEVKTIAGFYEAGGNIRHGDEFHKVIKGVRISQKVNPAEPERFIVSNILIEDE